MIRIGETFSERMRSPRSAPHMDEPIRLDLFQQMGGFVLAVRQEHGLARLEGFATAHDLRELSAMFAAAAEVLEAGAAA